MPPQEDELLRKIRANSTTWSGPTEPSRFEHVASGCILAVTLTRDESSSPLTLLVNWPALLKKW